MHPYGTIQNLRNQILDLEQQFSGSKSRSEVGEKNEYPTIMDYVWSASGSSTYGPTKAHLKYMNNANRLFDSQNNNNGGYNVGDSLKDAAQNMNDQHKEIYFQSGSKGK